MLRNIVVFWYFLGFLSCFGYVTFTNLRCSYANQTYGEFTQCHIKAVNRTHKYIDIYTKLYYKPLDNITVNMKLLRYDHGYKPFFIDLTIDGCQFMRNRNHHLAKVLYHKIRDYTNINHTCPFDHDIVLDKMWTGELDKDMTKYVPNLSGDFVFIANFYAYNKPLCDVKIYMSITKKHK